MQPKIMGILNVTPDSCYDGGEYFNLDRAIARGLQIEQEGANYLDIGGESTRPDASPVSLKDEIERTIPVIKALKSYLSIPFSIDTMKPEVAELAIQHGASLINDVTGFSNPRMVALAKETKVSLCLMHMLGSPQTMQKDPFYAGGIINYLLDWFKERIDHLIGQGIEASKIILDPGIGFGKTVADNLKIIHNLPSFKALGLPLLLGLSRKSFLTKICDKPRSMLLPATLGANVLAINSGADIIRVHDVKEHRDLVALLKAYNQVETDADFSTSCSSC